MRRQESASKGWQCPECGRRFVQRTREHSCDVRNIDSHLAKGSTEVRATFDAIRAVLASIGPCTVTPLKTMITLSVTSNFGGLTIKKSSVDLGFFLRHRLKHERITRIEEISPTKFAHHVNLTSPSDVDGEIEAWLREAYAIGVR